MCFAVLAFVLAVEYEVDAVSAKAVVTRPAREGFALALELGFDLVCGHSGVSLVVVKLLRCCYCIEDFCMLQLLMEFFCMINENIKKERVRLGLTQPAFALIAGVALRTLSDWEKGVSSPTAVQISALAAHGADALYIVTGRRSMAVAEMALLPNDERGLLDSYRRCSSAAKKSLLQTAALLAAGAEQTISGVTMRSGKNSKQVGSINAKGDVSF